jgi:c-di-GMP-related signal transduction protein
MLLTKLKREAIVKSDFSTFGYKFSLENQDEYPHNEAASVISTLIEFDVRKLTHGFLTFVDVEVDVDFIYSDFIPRIGREFHIVCTFDYAKLTNVYLLDYVEDIFTRLKSQEIGVCIYNFNPENSEISDKVLNSTSFIMMPASSDSKILAPYVDRGIKLICKDIASLEQMESALKDDLISYYMGPYVEAPKNIKVPRVEKPSPVITELFIKLKTPEDLQEATKIIKRSPELTFSILKFINAAFFAIPSKVSSVESAVSLLGFQNLRKWVNLIFLSSSVSNPDKNVYVEKSVSRAFFMEKVCKLMDPSKAPTAYMVGILSFMDVILGKSFEEIFEDIPVASEVREALVEGKNLFADLLDLVKAFEFQDQEKIEFYQSKYNLDKYRVERAYLDCLYEYDRFLDAIR